MAEKMAAHAWPIEQTAKELGTDRAKGLTSAEARARLERNGPNELNEKPRPGFLSQLWDQINNFLIWNLIAARCTRLRSPWILPFTLLDSIAAEQVKIYLRAKARRVEVTRSAPMALA